MRGCLSFIVFAAVLIGLLAWFVLPALAGPLVVASLSGAGLHGRDTQATVTANPPLELLLLRADRVRIRSSDVTIRGISVASVDLTLSEVGLLDRSFSTVDGTLEGVVATTAQGSTVGVPSVRVNGTHSVANATFTLPASLVVDLARGAVERSIGRSPDSVRLVAPDSIEFGISGATVQGVLTVNAAGDLIVQPSGGPVQLPTLELVAAGSVEPLALESVAVLGDGVQVQGRLDLAVIGL